MTCKVYMSESARVLGNRGSLRFVENKIKPKTCKLFGNTHSFFSFVNKLVNSDYYSVS